MSCTEIKGKRIPNSVHFDMYSASRFETVFFLPKMYHTNEKANAAYRTIRAHQ